MSGDLRRFVFFCSGLGKGAPQPHSDELNHLHHSMGFHDDVHGRPLEKVRAIRARKFEMKFFRKMEVDVKVDRSVAKQPGAQITTTRWIGTSKGDEINCEYRAKLVGREIQIDQRLDLCVATPFLESFRMISSSCASNQSTREPFRILSSDLKMAYASGRAKTPISIDIPVEDRQQGDENKVGRSNLCFYGTRDAAMNWQDEFTTVLVNSGFARGKASPCDFHRGA